MDHTRHMHIFQIPASFSVTVIGAGGIGATTILALAKMGVRYIQVYDADIVGEENLATQLHAVSDVGEYKVQSLQRTLQLYSDELEFVGMPEFVVPTTELRSSLIISAVDSITARQDIWRAVDQPESAWDFYIDARMAAEEYQHFMLRADDDAGLERYTKHLMGMDESSAPELACTEKATFFCAMAAATHIGVQVRNIVRGEAVPHRLIHKIPDNWLETFQL